MTRSGTLGTGRPPAARQGASSAAGGRPTAQPGRHRPKDPWKAAFFVLATVALISGTAWALFGSSFFVVRDIQVTGARHIGRSRVIAAADVALGTPLVSVNTSAVAHRVDGLARVRSATVRRSWPGTIVITITPRVAVLAVPEHSSYEVIDAYGVVLSRSPTAPAGLPVLTLPGGPATSLRGNATVHAAGTVVWRLPPWLRSQVSTVQATTPDAVTLTLRGGVTVLWGGPGGSAVKARELAILLRTRARYYDVSDPSSAATGSAVPSPAPSAGATAAPGAVPSSAPSAAGSSGPGGSGSGRSGSGGSAPGSAGGGASGKG